MTYVAVTVGFVYLAVIMDACSHKIVRYAIGPRIDARLTLTALDAAIALQGPPPGCIHHSARESQYAAEKYRERLRRAGLLGSVGRRGNPYDNAMMEYNARRLHSALGYLSPDQYEKQEARPPVKDVA